MIVGDQAGLFCWGAFSCLTRTDGTRFGCGRGTHGGGLPFSELRDAVLVLNAGDVGASGEAQGLCVCLVSLANAKETLPTRGLRSSVTFRLVLWMFYGLPFTPCLAKANDEHEELAK
jgi:hypothetical protein